MQAFLDISKKTQAQKTSNLKQNPQKKTKKMATPVELSWRFGEGKFHFGGGKLGVPLQMPFLSSSIFHNEKLSAFFIN